jgi:transposase-like protein
MDIAMILILSGAAIIGLGILSTAALRGWSQWLQVRRLEIEGCHPPARREVPAELKELRDRVRKLEAIANGVDF